MSFCRSALLSADEEIACGKLWQQDRNPEGIRRLVAGNHRFVVAQARHYEGCGVDQDDLIAEGSLGLIEAAKRFDPEGRSVRFLSFAGCWVRGAMTRALTRTGQTIVIPDNKWRALRKLIQAERKLGASATPESLAELLGVSTDEVEEIQALRLLQTSSTDQPLGEVGSPTVADMIPAREVSAEEVVRGEDLKSAMSKALDGLPALQRQILALRFGLGGDEQTLQSIADRLGLSRERVRQHEVAALARLGRNKDLKNH